MIGDLIDISRIEAGETTLNIRKTNINKMLQDLHVAFLPQGIQKSIRVDCRCDLSESESHIATDESKVNQILTNLLRNAVKYTTEGTVSFGYKHKNGSLEFYVSDTGSGIAPEMKDIIFERFMQADTGPTRKHEGTGLGLTICKAYAEQLGTSIRFESESGKGSTFFFALPYLS